MADDNQRITDMEELENFIEQYVDSVSDDDEMLSFSYRMKLRVLDEDGNEKDSEVITFGD